MNTDELFKSLSDEQTKAVNALLIKQRDDLTASHVSGMQELVAAKADELNALKKAASEAQDQSAACKSAQDIADKALAENISRQDSLIAAAAEHASNGDLDGMKSVLVEAQKDKATRIRDSLLAQRSALDDQLAQLDVVSSTEPSKL